MGPLSRARNASASGPSALGRANGVPSPLPGSLERLPRNTLGANDAMEVAFVTDRDTYELGTRRRREVLGDEYVDANLAGADELTRTFQELVTVQVWGRAWAGDALDDRTRALVTLGMLAALGRFDEMENYAKAATRCGASLDDIRDVLVHVTAYCGAPAGRQAFLAASRGLRSIGAMTS